MRLPDSERRFLRRLEEHARVDYAYWLDGDEWWNQRASYFSRQPCVCFVCGGPASCLHHRTYERAIDPPDADLVPLCAKCHTTLHARVEVALATGRQDCLLRMHEEMRAEREELRVEHETARRIELGNVVEELRRALSDLADLRALDAGTDEHLPAVAQQRRTLS